MRKWTLKINWIRFLLFFHRFFNSFLSLSLVQCNYKNIQWTKNPFSVKIYLLKQTSIKLHTQKNLKKYSHVSIKFEHVEKNTLNSRNVVSLMLFRNLAIVKETTNNKDNVLFMFLGLARMDFKPFVVVSFEEVSKIFLLQNFTTVLWENLFNAFRI